jgi:hypothetical protein
MLRFSSKSSILSAGILVLVGMCASAPALATFKCVDDRGVTHYGDIMPWQCAKTPINEVSGSGTVLKRYAAPLTPEQIAARTAQEIKDREAKRIAAEQKVKDAALLASYSTEKDFDISRDRELLQLETRMTLQQARVTDLDALVQKRKDELEFYKSGRVKKVIKVDPKNPPKPIEAPPELVSALERAEKERAAIDVQIANADAERKVVTARYEAEKARWVRLKYGETATVTPTAAKPVDAKAADTKVAPAAKK